MNFISSKTLKEVCSKEEVLLLDVRTNVEFEECHIQNSLHIPLNDLKGNEKALNEAKQIVVICKAGARACKGLEKLTPENQAKARVLDGGIDDWMKNNFLTESIKKSNFP